LNDDDLKGCNVSTDEGRSRLTAMGQENDGCIEIAARSLVSKALCSTQSVALRRATEILPSFA
jgi:hypothetical protein